MYVGWGEAETLVPTAPMPFFQPLGMTSSPPGGFRRRARCPRAIGVIRLFAWQARNASRARRRGRPRHWLSDSVSSIGAHCLHVLAAKASFICAEASQVCR